MLAIIFYLLVVVLIFIVAYMERSSKKYFIVFILLLLIGIFGIIGFNNRPDSSINYESTLESYKQEAQDIENELNEIIVTYSDIKSYDYTKLLSKMSYRKLIETYLPELIMPTKTSRGYSYKTKVGQLLDKYDDIQEKISDLERKYKSE